MGIDRWVARTRRGRLQEAHLTQLAPGIVRGILNKYSEEHLRHLQPGTRWAYVKVPEISKAWHPISLICSGKSSMIHVQSWGTWTKELFEKAASNDKLTMKLDGPYGSPLAPWHTHTPQRDHRGTLI